MMYNYPYIGYPFNKNYYRYFNQKPNSDYYNSINKNTTYLSQSNSYSLNEKVSNNDDIAYSTKRSNNEKKSNSEYIDIFGIRLHFDDILLILLIYFLYSEGVKDFGLFITLILLLLS